MTTDAKWIQREVLARLVHGGQVQANRARRDEVETLQGLGWIEPRTGSRSLYVPAPGRVADLRERLAFVWPDWEQEIQRAVAQGRDPYKAATYARDVRTVRVKLDVEELDDTMLFVLESTFEELRRVEGGVRLRIKGVSENELTVEITDPSPPSDAAFDARIARLERRLRDMAGRLRRQASVIVELQSRLDEARRYVLRGGAPAMEGDANLVLLAMERLPGAGGAPDAVSDLVRTVLHALGASADDALVMSTPQGPLVATRSADLAAEASFRARDVLRSLGMPTAAAVGRGTIQIEQAENTLQPPTLLAAASAEIEQLIRPALDVDEVLATQNFAEEPDLSSGKYRIMPLLGASRWSAKPVFVLRRLSNT